MSLINTLKYALKRNDINGEEYIPSHLSEAPQEPVGLMASGPALWVPFAVRVSPEMKTRGEYRKKYPEGAVVHFTSGHQSSDDRSVGYGRKQGHCYFVINQLGTIYQAFPLSHWGYHAGSSKWFKLPGDVSDELVGIEITNGSRLDEKNGKLVTWFGTEIPRDKVRYSAGKENQKKGWYERYTHEQEASLVKLLLWMHANNPSVFSLDLVVGHDEVAPTRKSDPGAALTWTMPELRKKLKEMAK